MAFRVNVLNDVKEFDSVSEFAAYIRNRAKNAEYSEHATSSIADKNYWNGMKVAYSNVAAMIETVDPIRKGKGK